MMKGFRICFCVSFLLVGAAYASDEDLFERERLGSDSSVFGSEGDPTLYGFRGSPFYPTGVLFHPLNPEVRQERSAEISNDWRRSSCFLARNSGEEGDPDPVINTPLSQLVRPVASSFVPQNFTNIPLQLTPTDSHIAAPAVINPQRQRSTPLTSGESKGIAQTHTSSTTLSTVPTEPFLKVTGKRKNPEPPMVHGVGIPDQPPQSQHSALSAIPEAEILSAGDVPRELMGLQNIEAHHRVLNCFQSLAQIVSLEELRTIHGISGNLNSYVRVQVGREYLIYKGSQRRTQKGGDTKLYQITPKGVQVRFVMERTIAAQKQRNISSATPQRQTAVLNLPVVSSTHLISGLPPLPTAIPSISGERSRTTVGESNPPLKEILQAGTHSDSTAELVHGSGGGEVLQASPATTQSPRDRFNFFVPGQQDLQEGFEDYWVQQQMDKRMTQHIRTGLQRVLKPFLEQFSQSHGGVLRRDYEDVLRAFIAAKVQVRDLNLHS